MKRRVSLTILIAACAIGASACNPVLRSHGYRYTTQDVPEIVVAEDPLSVLLIAQAGRIRPHVLAVFRRTPVALRN